MSLGLLGLAPMALLVLFGSLSSVVGSVMAVALVTALVLFGGAFLILRRKPSRLLILLLSGGVALISLGYYRFLTPAGFLRSVGVYYNPEAVNSDTLTRISFWYDGPNGRLPGPEIRGDRLVVGLPLRNRDGTLEFKVHSRAGESQTVLIQVVSPSASGCGVSHS